MKAMASITGGALITVVRRGQGHSRPAQTILTMLIIVSLVSKVYTKRSKLVSNDQGDFQEALDFFQDVSNKTIHAKLMSL